MMDFLLIIVMCFLLVPIVIFALEGELESLAVFIGLLLISAFLILMLYQITPIVTTKTIISNVYGEVQFSKPMKILVTTTDYPWTIMKDSKDVYIEEVE